MIKYLFGLIALLASSLATGQQELKVYHTFDSFASEIIDQRDTSLVTIVNFWATWCAPCIAEIPYFDTLSQQSEDVTVVLASMDFKNQIESKLKPFLAVQDLKATVVALTDSDYNAWIDRVTPEWSGAIPATIMFYKHHVFFAEKQYHSTEELLHDVKTLRSKE